MIADSLSVSGFLGHSHVAKLLVVPIAYTLPHGMPTCNYLVRDSSLVSKSPHSRGRPHTAEPRFRAICML